MEATFACATSRPSIDSPPRHGLFDRRAEALQVVVLVEGADEELLVGALDKCFVTCRHFFIYRRENRRAGASIGVIRDARGCCLPPGECLLSKVRRASPSIFFIGGHDLIRHCFSELAPHGGVELHPPYFTAFHRSHPPKARRTIPQPLFRAPHPSPSPCTRRRAPSPEHEDERVSP